MVEKAVLGTFDQDRMDALYPMLFGVSCAYVALRLLPESETREDEHKWLEIRNRMLKGSAHLLGLLIWRVQRDSQIGETNLLQKLESAHQVIDELKKRRSEEAKANEKVMSIFAAREQTWFDERKQLRRQVGALINALRVVHVKRETSLSELDKKLKEKDGLIEEEVKKRREIEERAKKAEEVVEELRESAKHHADEVLKHKTAFIELVSNQRHLEAEMGRVLREVEAAKEEAGLALAQKEKSVLMAQRVSMELVKTREDLEQKDRILSVMLRKSRLDTVEKEVLLKEMKSSKVKRQQAELETARWKAVSESRHSLRNMWSKRLNGKSMDAGNVKDVNRVENWVENTVEDRHKRETDAFAEQLRIKDEKLEALRWRLLSMEMESKRLQSHVERVDHNMAQLRQENVKLESLLLDCDMELRSLRLNSCPHEAAANKNIVWSNVKVVKRKHGQKRNDLKAIPEEVSQVAENEKTGEMPAKDIVLTLKYPIKEMQGENDAGSGQCCIQQECVQSDDAGKAETSSSTGHRSSKRSSSTWKMDVYALGVSYKIKRLKQQLVMLERLGVKGFYTLTSLLNKQIDRYQSLQGRTDDLCQRMHDSNLKLGDKCSAIARTEDETRQLGHFLEETFQLQRYVVATGQKLTEVQAKIKSGFVCDVEKVKDFDMQQYGDGMRTLFGEVERGLQVRICRIIGDLEGVLACNGIINLKKKVIVHI